MEERDNRTIMCSVLFLDIVEYSKKSVSGQISLKDRFNAYLSAAIRDVPIADRIILDTGDGAAINFLGDVEDALKAALSLRGSLLNEDVNMDPPLLVRMGINLGPVRLVRDINGQPNIVGDGINVAQRVMGFADAAQILVSRSYFDAVSRLSPKYAGMFHYQGSRTDKHVREHEVYAIGYPGDKTIKRGKAQSPFPERAESSLLDRTKTVWHSAAARLDAILEHPLDSFRQAEPVVRALYVGVAAAPLVLIAVLLAIQVRHNKSPVVQTSIGGQAATTMQSGSAVAAAGTIQPASAVAAIQPASAVAAASAVSGTKARDAVQKQSKVTAKTKVQKPVEGKKPADKPKRQESQEVTKTKPKAAGTETAISISCGGAEVFIDGTRKGRITSSPLTVKISPGKHSVIVNHEKGVFSKEISFDAGNTVQLKPDFCN